MKSKKTLDSFIGHCNHYPDERFWQALLHWSSIYYTFKFDVIDRITITARIYGQDFKDHDTYYLD